MGGRGGFSPPQFQAKKYIKMVIFKISPDPLQVVQFLQFKIHSTIPGDSRLNFTNEKRVVET